MTTQARRLTKTEIIDETVAYYGEDPYRRAEADFDCQEYKARRCFYLTSDGRKCAFGRCMVAPEMLGEKTRTVSLGTLIRKRLASSPNLNSLKMGKLVANELRQLALDSYLHPRYHGHSESFWRDLQGLHDCVEFWNTVDGGLSECGREQVATMKKQWR